MNKDKNALIWLKNVLLGMIGLVLVASIITYIVDPYFQFRVKNHYMLSVKYCAPGLIKNYDYDTLMLGSSMTQNFNMPLMREQLQCNPLHIGNGGMTEEDQIRYLQYAEKIGKAKTYYLCVDLVTFQTPDNSEVAEYLMKNDLLSRMRYMLQYESWMRYLPIDLGLSGIHQIKGRLPDSLKYRADIDYLGYWGHQFTYGEEVVLSGYSVKNAGVSQVQDNHLYQTMVSQIDGYLEQIGKGDADYILFFPPYSALYWANAKWEGYLDTFLEAKEYFVERCLEKGLKVYDFQSDALTLELDHYKDITHYSPDINDWMIYQFTDQTYVVTEENYPVFRQRLMDNVDEFIATHHEIFPE